MNILFIIIGGLLLISVIILVAGLFLPAERVVTRQSVFPTTPETLYRIVTNNEDWKYRTDLKKLIIIEKQGDHEVWDEVSHDGGIVRFETMEKVPHSYYSFRMKSTLFTGYWTATFEPTAQGSTLFTANEYIKVKNPFIKTLSYLFFHIDKFMEVYQGNLQKKVAEGG